MQADFPTWTIRVTPLEAAEGPREAPVSPAVFLIYDFINPSRFLNRVGNHLFYLTTGVLDVVVGLNVDDFGFLCLFAIS